MFFYKLLNFFTMTEFWDKPAEKSGKVLVAFLEGQPLIETKDRVYTVHANRQIDAMDPAIQWIGGEMCIKLLSDSFAL